MLSYSRRDNSQNKDLHKILSYAMNSIKNRIAHSKNYVYCWSGSLQWIKIIYTHICSINKRFFISFIVFCSVHLLTNQKREFSITWWNSDIWLAGYRVYRRVEVHQGLFYMFIFYNANKYATLPIKYHLWICCLNLERKENELWKISSFGFKIYWLRKVIGEI